MSWWWPDDDLMMVWLRAHKYGGKCILLLCTAKCYSQDRFTKATVSKCLFQKNILLHLSAQSMNVDKSHPVHECDHKRQTKRQAVFFVTCFPTL